MKSKILISILILLLILNVLSGISLADLGSQEDYIEDFEDDFLTDGSPNDYYYGEKWLQIENQTANSYVHNVAQTGTKGYYIKSADSKAYCNFTYSSSEIITNLSFGLYLNDPIPGLDLEIRCYDENDVAFLHFYQNIDRFYWQSYGGANQMGQFAEDTWLNISFEIKSNDTIDVFDGELLYEFAPLVVLDNPRISYMTIELNFNGQNIYFDNIKIVPGIGEEEDEDEGTVPPCDPYSTVGNLGVGDSTIGFKYRYLWTTYGVETRLTVHRLDFEITSDMADVYSTGDISCKMGTSSLGTASSIVELSSGHYRVSWSGLNVYINNTPCPIMFRFREDFPVRDVFSAEFYVTNDDINKDGWLFCVFSNSHEYWNNFANHIDEYPSGGIENQPAKIEPVIRMCVEYLGGGELKEHIDNDIWCYPIVIENNSFTRIGYSLNLSTMSGTNKFILIQRPDNTSENIFSTTTQTGHTTYTAHQLGLHYANISIDDVHISSTSFTVTGNLDDWIETKPNPSVKDGDFDIIYNYSKTNRGVIRIYDGKEILKETFYVNPESYGTEKTSLPIGKYTIKLQEMIIVGTTTQYVTLFVYSHSVQGQVVDYIVVDTLGLTDDPKITTLEFGFRAHGMHNHVGENIVIRVTGMEEVNVGDRQAFSHWFYPLRSDYYRVSLILKKGDGTELELDWDYITVRSEIFIDTEKTDLENLMDLIPDFYKLIAGIVITIVITISPILLVSQIAQFAKVPVDFKVPSIAYPILAIAATLLCVTLGLYGIEITFFFLAICVIAGFLVYYSGRNGGNS